MDHLDRATLLRRAGLGAAALALQDSGSALAAAATFPVHPRWNFVFVNHMTTDPFFVATYYGAADAAALVDVDYHWTGSTRNDVSEMVDAFNAAVTVKADGIAVSVIDRLAFEAPIASAIAQGIPVVSYNADGARDGAKARMAYIGQDLYASGFAMGQRIAALVPRGNVALFISAPGSLDLKPRIDGAKEAIRLSGRPIDAVEVATGLDLNGQYLKIDAYSLGHRKLKGLFAVDTGNTQGVGRVIQRRGLRGKGVKGGGFDLSPTTLRLIDQGELDFTIDQQPYLQGFYSVIQLFLYRLSGGLISPSDMNTGLLFVTKANVKPYLTTKTRYEGSSSVQKYPVS